MSSPARGMCSERGPLSPAWREGWGGAPKARSGLRAPQSPGARGCRPSPRPAIPRAASGRRGAARSRNRRDSILAGPKVTAPDGARRPGRGRWRVSPRGGDPDPRAGPGRGVQDSRGRGRTHHGGVRGREGGRPPPPAAGAGAARRAEALGAPSPRGPPSARGPAPPPSPPRRAGRPRAPSWREPIKAGDGAPAATPRRAPSRRRRRTRAASCHHVPPLGLRPAQR